MLSTERTSDLESTMTSNERGLAICQLLLPLRLLLYHISSQDVQLELE